MATLSSWTNDGHSAMPIGIGLEASRYAHGPWLSAACYHIALCLLAARYAYWRRAMPIGCGMMYHVLRFWQRKGQPFWLGLVLCPTLGSIDYIYLKTINTKYKKIYILKRRKSFSPYPFSIYILKRTYKFFV